LTLTLIDVRKAEALKFVPDFFVNLVVLPAQDYP
jgi:hypothetical protein